MPKAENNAASQPDEENPEWTENDLRNARPARAVLGEVFGEKAARSVSRRPGRPIKADRKVNQTLRLDADVLAAYRKLGRGWQVQMNRVLRQNMPTK
jgi:uncharacterized protein (DUF4415 family)